MTPISSVSRSFNTQSHLKKKDLTPVSKQKQQASIFNPIKKKTPVPEIQLNRQDQMRMTTERTVDEFSINVTTEVEVPVKLEDHMKNEMPLQQSQKDERTTASLATFEVAEEECTPRELIPQRHEQNGLPKYKEDSSQMLLPSKSTEEEEEEGEEKEGEESVDVSVY